MITAKTCVYTVATEWTFSVCTVWSHVCSVCTEWTVLLVPLILLIIVNVLVDTSAQIKLSKGPERGQIELSKLLSILAPASDSPVVSGRSNRRLCDSLAVVTAFLLQQQVYVYGWPGCDYGGRYGGRFKRM